MENDTAGTGACSSETANGGEVVWSCNQSDAASADHLVVMVHGILGRSCFICLYLISYVYIYLSIYLYVHLYISITLTSTKK